MSDSGGGDDAFGFDGQSKAGSEHKEEDREKLQEGADEDEQMEHGVKSAAPRAEDVEDGTGGIGEPPGEEQEKARSICRAVGATLRIRPYEA